MHIYFDLDNTLIDEKGETVRPGAYELLNSFKNNNIKLSIWTASVRQRAEPILEKLNLAHYFDDVVCREDYDPEATWGRSKPKDIRYGDGDMLVDDNQGHIDFVESIGRRGFKVSSFITYTNPHPDLCELEQLHSVVLPNIEFRIKRDKWFVKLVNRLTKKKQPLPGWIE